LTRASFKGSDVKTKIRFLSLTATFLQKGKQWEKNKNPPFFLEARLLTSFKVSSILFGMTDILAFS
jgi:hypothetical protein